MRRGGGSGCWLSWLLLLFFTAATTCCRVSAQAIVQEEKEQVKWTANPNDVADDGSGPLPLSSQQRQQLTELERVIRQSPDPEATLRQVAASNDMDPQDLANILQRNRSDLMGGGEGGGVGGRRPLSARNNRVTQLLGAVTVLLKRNPKLSTGIISIALIVLYLRYIEIPRTGVCLSTSRSSYWWSRGPTTLLPPPNAFVQRLLRQVEDNETTSTTVLYRSLLELVPITSTELEPGEVQSIKKRSKLWKRAFVTEQPISLHRRRRHHTTNEEEEEVVEEDAYDVDEIMLDQASRLLTDPRTLVEWIPGVRIMTSTGSSSSVASNDKNDNDDDDSVESNQKQKITLVYPGFGDFRRYALLSFVVLEQPSDQRLILSTAKGSYFDGQLIIDIIAAPDHHHRVRVSMIVVKGRALPKTFLSDMANSIAKSLQARTRQVLARRAQSERYRTSSQAYVAQRRAQRDTKAREMEEMNADRRRRWQRTNPNAGQYRPSGERMRSPNNAVY
jgi:hypothetical protein